MTPLAPTTPPQLVALRAGAAAAGLAVRATACWPETDTDAEVPPLAGFIESTFSPLFAAVAARALARRPEPAPPERVTAVVLVTPLGDVTSAAYVARAVDAGERVGPLLFFQSVPNIVIGHVAARWGLTGPVVCVAATEAGLAEAALLLEDADADEVLVVRLDLAAAADERDAAAAVVVTRTAERDAQP